MLITLMFLPLKVSMSLAAFLSLMLLALALAMVKRSLLMSALALALIGMTWRAEAWKAAYREIAIQVSLLPPQCRQLLPKTVSSQHDALFVDAVDGIGQFYGQRDEERYSDATLAPLWCIPRNGRVRGQRSQDANPNQMALELPYPNDPNTNLAVLVGFGSGN